MHDHKYLIPSENTSRKNFKLRKQTASNTALELFAGTSVKKMHCEQMRFLYVLEAL